MPRENFQFRISDWKYIPGLAKCAHCAALKALRPRGSLAGPLRKRCVDTLSEDKMGRKRNS